MREEISRQTLVSVIMPVDNRLNTVDESAVRATVASALAQTVRNMELLIVIDGEAPDLISPLSDFKDDPRIVLLCPKEEKPHGFAHACYRGVREARGWWVGFLRVGDLWAPDKLERQIRALLHRKNAEFCTADSLFFSREKGEAYRKGNLPETLSLRQFLRRPDVSLSSFLARTDEMRGCSFPEDTANPIIPICIRLLKRGSALHLPKPLCACSEEGNGLTVKEAFSLYRKAGVGVVFGLFFAVLQAVGKKRNEPKEVWTAETEQMLLSGAALCEPSAEEDRNFSRRNKKTKIGLLVRSAVDLCVKTARGIGRFFVGIWQAICRFAVGITRKIKSIASRWKRRIRSDSYRCKSSRHEPEFSKAPEKNGKKAHSSHSRKRSHKKKHR